MKKPGRNDLCLCGSGRKFKKCCLTTAVSPQYTRDERASAFAKLDRFIDDVMGAEDELAFEEFWGEHLEWDDELAPEHRRQSSDVYDLWFAFDRDLDDGRLVIDLFLDRHPHLSTGERLFLTTLRRSSMRLYEIVDLSPGVSVTLRDVVEKTEVTVHEQTGSRTLQRHEWLAARVVSSGSSGQPEIEAGLLHVPRSIRDSVLAQLSSMRDEFRRAHPEAPLDDFYKRLPPFFHAAWATSILDPPIPELRNTVGDEMVLSHVSFDVLDVEALLHSLQGQAALEREGAVWRWTGTNPRRESVTLGLFRLQEKSLVLETNSVQRAERGRTLLESLASGSVRHRATSHENVRRRLRDELRARARAGADDDARPPSSALPRELNETLVLNHLARHYRGWLDESLPALDGRTPREAARDEALRPRLVDLIHGLEGMYESALRSGQPAYDPSWMWSELGFDDGGSPAHPPPLAHERIAELVPGSGELSRAVAEQLRRAPGFKDASALMSVEAFNTHLDLQRFVREHDRAAASHVGAAGEGPSVLAGLLRLMVNFELHRRKSFWVDESLAYTLDQTDLDVAGRELRAPFPSFALVFTDRHVLSQAERTVAAGPSCPVAGHLLRVATVFVTEHSTGESRTLELAFALDTLGADLPHVVRHSLRLKGDEKVEAYLDRVAPRVAGEPTLPDSNPLRALLRVTINAILYATSAGIQPEARRSPTKTAHTGRGGAPVRYSSDEVYFLPGVIEISQLRRMQELHRIPAGHTIARRFMVRGHWRRAPVTAADRRMRWVRPYWKGPDMATIIERTYKLKP
jgi:hypothetical protein